MARGIDVLGEDCELACALEAARLARARRCAVAAAIELPVGLWDAVGSADAARDGYGLLMMEGLLVRRVGRDGRFGAELLGGGDIIRPWEHDGEASTLPFDTVWRVLAPVRLAVLDLAWARRVAPFPEVGAQLMGRALDRSRRLAVSMAIAQHPRLEVRLHVVLWHLAERFGRVRPDGVHFVLPVTHETLGYLVAARRPSVSAALGRLSEQGFLTSNADGWVLHGDPPADLDEG